MYTYCGSGFFPLMCVQLYKQNRYRDIEIKGYVEGVESSSMYTIRAVMPIQSYVTHVEGVESSSLYTIRAVMPCMSEVLKEAQNGLEHFCS